MVLENLSTVQTMDSKSSSLPPESSVLPLPLSSFSERLVSVWNTRGQPATPSPFALLISSTLTLSSTTTTHHVQGLPGAVERVHAKPKDQPYRMLFLPLPSPVSLPVFCLFDHIHPSRFLLQLRDDSSWPLLLSESIREAPKGSTYPLYFDQYTVPSFEPTTDVSLVFLPRDTREKVWFSNQIDCFRTMHKFHVGRICLKH